jgi:Xaa-Pro aminopeptidase
MKPISSNNLDLNVLKDQRINLTKKFMETHEVDILVVVSTDSIQNRGNVRFLTNYPTVYGSSLAVQKNDEDPILIVPAGSFQVGWAQRTVWTNDIRAVQDFASSVGNLIEESENEIGAVGLVGFDNMPGSLMTQITSPFPDLKFINLSSSFRLMKAVKSGPEIGMARKSVSIADDVFTNLVQSANIGTPENEIFAQASYDVNLGGAEDCFFLGSSDSQTVISFPAERSLSKGDLIRFSIEPSSRGGFWTQTIRTFSVGNPSEDAQTAFNLCKEALLTAIEALKPGKLGGEISNSMIKVMKEVNDGEIGPLGHGMGLDLVEPPLMLPQDETVIKPGMIIAVHPSFTWKDIDIWIGDTFLVTESGVENLSNYPNELHIL